MLKIDWVHPVWKPVETAATGKPATTAAPQIERALPLAQAFELVTDGDRRPVLILRECEKCKGTDHALLAAKLDNEQTVLLAHWFRCVKLPPNVLDEKHPFYNLWKREKEGDRVPHLFFVDPDGSNRTELPGDQSQTVLWNVMFGYLERCYGEDAKAAIKQLRPLLGQYDKLDQEETLTKDRIDKELEKNGPESPKLKELDGDLAKLGKQREKLRAKEKELRELALKSMPTPPKPAAGKPPAAPAKPADGAK